MIFFEYSYASKLYISSTLLYSCDKLLMSGLHLANYKREHMRQGLEAAACFCGGTLDSAKSERSQEAVLLQGVKKFAVVWELSNSPSHCYQYHLPTSPISSLITCHSCFQDYIILCLASIIGFCR